MLTVGAKVQGIAVDSPGWLRVTLEHGCSILVPDTSEGTTLRIYQDVTITRRADRIGKRA